MKSKSFPEQAVDLIVWSLNIWLLATGSQRRIAARDIVMTERDGVLFIAFPIQEQGQ